MGHKNLVYLGHAVYINHPKQEKQGKQKQGKQKNKK